MKKPESPPCFLTGPASGFLVKASGIAGRADRVGVPEGRRALHLAPPLHTPLFVAL